MIVITGAAGFIGSCMLTQLIAEGYQDLILVDDFGRKDKHPNYLGKAHRERVDRMQLFDWLAQQGNSVDYVIHLGARTDTTEQDSAIFDQLNLSYSQRLWRWCVRTETPLIYASSAATYGNGQLGFVDRHDLIPELKPLNPYGQSKQDFDRWVLTQKEAPPSWAGLKFFNVYGPNEYHKGRMASVVFHAYYQIGKTGQMKLFRSHREDVADGEQSRDFVYVKDVIRVISWIMKQPATQQIFNLGTGKARSFRALVETIFSTMHLPTTLSFIDTPADIRTNYQYFTEADMQKLRAAGYQTEMYDLEEGVGEYIQDFLSSNMFY